MEDLGLIAGIISLIVIVIFIKIAIDISVVRKILKYQIQFDKKKYLENGGKINEKISKEIDGL